MFLIRAVDGKASVCNRHGKISSPGLENHFQARDAAGFSTDQRLLHVLEIKSFIAMRHPLPGVTKEQIGGSRPQPYPRSPHALFCALALHKLSGTT